MLAQQTKQKKLRSIANTILKICKAYLDNYLILQTTYQLQKIRWNKML